MTLRDDLEKAVAAACDGKSHHDITIFIRDHGPALLDAVDKAGMWDMCNRTLVEGEVEVRCHVIVGLNEWEGGHWNGYTTCSPDELKEITTAALEGENTRAIDKALPDPWRG